MSGYLNTVTKSFHWYPWKPGHMTIQIDLGNLIGGPFSFILQEKALIYLSLNKLGWLLVIDLPIK